MLRSFTTFSVWPLLLVLLTFTASLGGERPKIIVGGDHENPPYEFIENGQPTGFNVDLMRAVADAVGLEAEFRLGPWGDVRKKLEQGKIDALAGMYYSEERSRLVDFSVPHTMVSAGLFVREGSPIRSIDDIKGKEVIVQKGDVIDDYLREKGITSRIVEVKDPADVLRLLASGRHDCALMPSRFQGEYLLKVLGISNVRVTSANLPQFRYCFAVKKGNSSLKYRLDEGLNILKVNGKYQKIYDKWFGVYEQSRLWRTVRYFVWALGLIAGLLAASSIWSWILRREVRNRTADLRRREEELRFTQYAIDKTIDQAFWMTEDGRFFYVNDAACRALGYTREELLQMSVPDIGPTVPPEVFAEHWRDLQENGYVTLETLHRAKDGRVYPVEIRANYVVFDGKEYNCAFATDISERKRAEEELRQAHDELEKRVEERTLALRNANELLLLSQFCIDKAGIGIYQSDETGAIFSVNEHACESLGYSSEELCSLSVFDIDPEITPERMLELKEFIDERGSATHQTTHRRRDGTTFPVEITANVLDFQGKKYGISFVKDITKRKRIEEELLLSHFCIDNAAIGIFQISLDDGKILRVNDSACRSLGYSSDELRTMTIFDVDPSLADEQFVDLKRTVDQSSSMAFETIHRRKDGTTFPVEVTANNLVFQDKKYGITFIKDITDRKQAEESLKRTKEEWERTFASVPDLIAILDNQYRVLRVNEAMARRLGLKPDECVGLHCYEAIHGLSEPPEFCPHTRTLRDGREHVVEVHEERLGGDFLVSTIPLNDERGVMIGSVHIAYDITERKRAEEALQESESRVRRKLDSILDPEGDIGELDLADIIDAPQIQALMDDLYRNTGLKMSIIDLKGRVLVDVGWQEICLKFHRNHPETLKRCLESDTLMTEGIPPGEFRTYRCKNNIWHIVTPIFVGGRHMGNLFMGQFFFENEELDYGLFRAQARAYGFPEEEYMAALEAVPRRSEECVNKGKAFFLRLIDMFSKLSYGNIKLSRSLAERDRLTATLRESEAQLKIVMDLAKLVPWEYDVRTGLFTFDDQFYALYGTTADQEGGTLMSAEVYARKFIPPEESAVVANGIEEARVNSHVQLEHRIIRADGEERFIVVRGEAIFDQEGRFVKIRGANQDITERKRAEEELRESRAKYQAIVDNFEGLIYICSQDYRVEFMNRKLIERTGYDATGEFCYRMMHGRDSVCPWCVNERVFTGETLHWEMFSPKDNHWYYVVNVPIPHADGTISKQSMMLDITDRKQAEEELRKANMVVENSPVVLFRCKAAPGWPVELVSKNVIQFGYAPEEFLSGKLTYSSIVYPRDMERLTAETEEYSATGKGKWLQEYRIVTKEGDLRWISDETVCERNEEGEITYYEGVIIDVTERRKAEEQLLLQQMQLRDLNRTLEVRVQEEVTKNREKDIILIQQNRQAALGEMFDHIAHQWKQPLNSIALIIQALGLSCAHEQVTTKDILETVDSIMDMVGHMAQTVEVFRNFYNPDKEKSIFLVNDSIGKALSFVTPIFRLYGIEVDLDADPELSAFGYPKEYAQVLLNILANAKDAFRERGVENPRIDIKAFADGDDTVVTITDNAGGIHDKSIEKIFDLYFTTKESSGGTGIGLYMSKNIIEKNMGGKLSVCNFKQGTQFRIELGLPIT